MSGKVGETPETPMSPLHVNLHDDHVAITDAQIIETAKKLASEGVNPTLVTVRDALGKGRFSTIGPALKRWKESRAEKHEMAQVEVPGGISEWIEQFKGAIWQAAVDVAERRLQAEREALQEARARAEQEVTESLEAVRTLEAELEKQSQELETVRGRAATVEQAVTEATQAATEATTRLESTQRELEQERDRVARLEIKAEKAQAEASELRGELKAYCATKATA